MRHSKQFSGLQGSASFAIAARAAPGGCNHKGKTEARGSVSLTRQRMRPLLCIAVLAAIACAASATPTLTNFVLQAHGQRIRFGFAAPATPWSGSTANATWVPAQSAQCTAGLITVVKYASSRGPSL